MGSRLILRSINISKKPEATAEARKNACHFRGTIIAESKDRGRFGP
ncbi:hypothetical protein D1BOALGB6SA_4809 [Olavius sp. associated proteobacterium Delta 1]|nr:hypothetical protein D1BOALGB6SA_4809 [Olavius sp. associated proteobacterium Delta 1]